MTLDIRKELEQLMRSTLADEAAHHDWTYTQYRPRFVPTTWYPGENIYGDCSKGVQFLCKWGGAPDPMGSGFGPYGNSQTIWLVLHHVDTPGELEVGDIVVFGWDGSEHATMVLVPGNDPLLWSFGHQGAPNTYRLSQDKRIAYYCKINVPDPPPTPQDKLRAKKGFYAWVAWRLGEGPWKHYGKKNKTVRPDVPRVISLKWWIALAKFLKNRKKGNKSTTKP